MFSWFHYLIVFDTFNIRFFRHDVELPNLRTYTRFELTGSRNLSTHYSLFVFLFPWAKNSCPIYSVSEQYEIMSFVEYAIPGYITKKTCESHVVDCP